MDENKIEGHVVNVVSGDIFPGFIEFSNGVITGIEQAESVPHRYLIPGLIDAHIHIESSHLCPARFAEAVVPHGTTAVVSDPHEIANVLGVDGIKYMIHDSKKAPLRCFFTAPSCVPATPFETSGANLSHLGVAEILSWPEIVALGEVMDFPSAVAGDKEVLLKIDAAKKAGKPIDGHAPLLTGDDLKKYVSLGITTDHECTSSREAEEKYDVGMTIQVRQGTASKDLLAHADFAKNHPFMLVSDDRSALDLFHGHMDIVLREAVSFGIEPLSALRAVTVLPAKHYGLPGGWFEEGRAADIAVIDDLRTFRVDQTWISGKLMATNGKANFSVAPEPILISLPKIRKQSQEFGLRSKGRSVRARVMVALKDEIATEKMDACLPVEADEVVPDVSKDVLRIAVVNRYRDAPVANSFVKGFGLREGAIASTVAHDSHNCVVVGVEKSSMAEAANRSLERGGLSVIGRGKATVLDLPIGGLMTYDSVIEVSRITNALLDHARELGSNLHDPFMTLSFMSLLVVPRLKLSDRGLFDVDRFEFVDTIVSS